MSILLQSPVPWILLTVLMLLMLGAWLIWIGVMLKEIRDMKRLEQQRNRPWDGLSDRVDPSDSLI